MLRILCVCAARPNFMKIAPIVSALSRTARVQPILVHTGQHYDERMSRQFFDELGIPRPDVNLEVGSGSHAVQTAEVMRRFEEVCLVQEPDWVVVVGDVNSTLAAALTAVKLGIRVAHVEAGLRSFDRTMPEEINRVATDAISDVHFATERAAVENLRREGIAASQIHLVGNVMIDTLLRNSARAADSTIHQALGTRRGGYALVTLHRPANVDDASVFGGILDALETIARDMPLILPLHPRTRHNLERLGLLRRTNEIAGLTLTEPLGYIDFLRLMTDAALVLTDSGGIQEETTILQVPCLTVRENTERPVTVIEGTNRLAGCSPEGILAAYQEVRKNPPAGRIPELWDGRAAERIAAVLATSLQESQPVNPATCLVLEGAR